MSYPDWVSESECDSERQSFWNGDDEDRDADDEKLDVAFNVVHVPWFVVDDERRNWEVEDENHNRQQSYCRACNHEQ